MSLLPFFEWCEATPLGAGIRESTVLFPLIEAVHLVALAFLGGAVLVVDLRLMNVGLTQLTVPEVARNARPWLVGSLALMIGSGVLLFLSEATKCYFNPAFWIKMIALAAAIAFSFTIRRRVSELDGQPSMRNGLMGTVSLLLWLTVGIAGRVIGFY